MRRSQGRRVSRSRSLLRRVVLEDLLHDVAPLGEGVEREPVDFIIHTAQYAAVTARLGRDVARGLLDQPHLVQLYEREGVGRVPVADDERVARELHETEIPEGLPAVERHLPAVLRGAGQDRKSTRLNSSHVSISYAVFCLKKKN